MEYCFHAGCDEVFGCVGLKRKNSVFLISSIRRRVSSFESKNYFSNDCIWQIWSIFPKNLSPHAYNDTLAMDLSTQQRRSFGGGYKWRDVEDAVKSDANLSCSDCNKSYKLIPQEIDFYAQNGIPHHKIAHFADTKLDRNNQIDLAQRNCDKCSKQIMSTVDLIKLKKSSQGLLFRDIDDMLEIWCGRDFANLHNLKVWDKVTVEDNKEN